MNIVNQLKSLGRRLPGQPLSGQRPVTQPPESTIRRAAVERERIVNLGPRAIVTLSLAIIVAACGGGSGSGSSNPGGGSSGNGSGSAPSAQPAASTAVDEPQGAGGLCDYLTSDAAATALGEAVDGGVAKTSSISGTEICRYTSTTGTEHAIQIEFKGDVARADWEDSVGGAGMLDEQPIEGIGEVAFRSDNAVLGPGTRLVAFDHGTTIWVVMYTDRESSEVFASAESVAKDLLTTLAS